MLADKEQRDEIFSKLRELNKSFFKDELKGMAIISAFDNTHFSDVPNITAPTVSDTTLAGVSWEIARYFEDL